MTMSTQPLTPEIVSQEGNAMVLSMGPQHPSTHGVLQIMLEIEGESVVKAEPEIGYLHTGIEKTAENLFWSQAQTVIERMDYLAPESNSLCYALAVERLLGITDRIPERARIIRVLQMELTRIASHCVWLGTHGIDLGAISVFFLLLRFARKHPRLARSRRRRPHASELRPRRRAQRRPSRRLPRETRRVHRQVSRTHARSARTAAGQPDLPRSYDRRRRAFTRSGDRMERHRAERCAAAASPTTSAKRFRIRDTTYEFDVPTRSEGDAYARFLVRLDEMEQSHRIIEQARRRLDVPGPVLIDDPKVTAPPKETIALSMEALIHHFKIVSEGFRVPPGDATNRSSRRAANLGITW